MGNGPTNATDPNGLEEKPQWHHTAAKRQLLDLELIDLDGNTTSKVTGGSTNIHGKEWGYMLSPNDHIYKPDGVHCKDAIGTGKTYDTHFKEEVMSRMDRNGNISLDDLQAARDATIAKYPSQFGAGTSATEDWSNDDQKKWKRTQTRRLRRIGKLSVVTLASDPIGALEGVRDMVDEYEGNTFPGTYFWNDSGGKYFYEREPGLLGKTTKVYVDGPRMGERDRAIRYWAQAKALWKSIFDRPQVKEIRINGAPAL